MFASPPRALRLRVELLDVRPVVWRQLRVPETLTFAGLHRVLQVAMGWDDYHLHRFHFEGVTNSDGGSWASDTERTTRLADLALRPGDAFVYEYDFGDRWEHEVRVEAVLDGDLKKPHPVCTGGSRACPPEDSGGPWGYMEQLRARKNKKRSDLGRGFDPARFRRGPVNDELRRPAYQP